VNKRNHSTGPGSEGRVNSRCFHMKKISNFSDLKKFDNRLEAEAAAALLRVNKIECIIFADDCGGMEPRMHLTAGV